MKKRWGILLVSLYLLTGLFFIKQLLDIRDIPEGDVVAVNRIIQTVKSQWPDSFTAIPDTPYEYSVLDETGKLLFQTSSQAASSIYDGVKRHDTIMDITREGSLLGKVIITADFTQFLEVKRKKLIWITFCMTAAFFITSLGYLLFLDNSIYKPFQNLKGFARHIAAGNLEIPLEMDRNNLFGLFTESFDIMREQLKEARQKEAMANQSKKELVASLSHDIKTPVTSIKLVSELMLVTESREEVKTKLQTIYKKAEQIDLLITNMLHATLEDLGELSVNPTEESSQILEQLILNSDFYHKAEFSNIPQCLIYTDILRLGQVFDNIINNSYKYAGTKIHIYSEIIDSYLRIEIRDWGPGVPREDLPKLFKKFYRGSNTEGLPADGSGLGLYICKYLMEKMDGEIQYFNRTDGFSVELLIRLV